MVVLHDEEVEDEDDSDVHSSRLGHVLLLLELVVAALRQLHASSRLLSSKEGTNTSSGNVATSEELVGHGINPTGDDTSSLGIKTESIRSIKDVEDISSSKYG